MEDKLAERLVTRILSGDTARYEDVVDTHYRAIYGVCLRLVHDGTLAEKYASLTFLRAFENLSGFLTAKKELFPWLVGQLREVLKDNLKQDQWLTTPFARGQELYSDPLWIPSLRPELLDGSHRPSKEDLRRLNQSLKSAHQLLLELHFVDRVSLEELGELFDVSATILRSFLFGLFDVLASLSELEHSGDCDPDLFLGLSTLLVRDDPEKLRGLMDSHTRCAGCGLVIERTERLARLLSIDMRPRAKADPSLMSRIIATPQKIRTKKVYTYVPIRKMKDSPASNVTHLWVPALIILLFSFVSWHMLEGNLDRSPSSQTVAAMDRAAAAKAAGASVARQRIGLTRDLRGLPTPFYENAEIRAPMHSSLRVEYDEGSLLELAGGSSVQAGSAHLTLVNGSLRLEARPKDRDLFTVYASKTIGKTRGGTLLVSQRPGAETLFAVERGEAELVLPDGRKVTVTANRQARVQSDGRFVVEGFDAALFGNAAGGGGGSAIGAGSAAAQGGGRGTPGAAPSSFGSIPGTAPLRRPPASPNRAQPFRGVRGYRHYF